MTKRDEREYYFSFQDSRKVILSISEKHVSRIPGRNVHDSGIPTSKKGLILKSKPLHIPTGAIYWIRITPIKGKNYITEYITRTKKSKPFLNYNNSRTDRYFDMILFAKKKQILIKIVAFKAEKSKSQKNIALSFSPDCRRNFFFSLSHSKISYYVQGKKQVT